MSGPLQRKIESINRIRRGEISRAMTRYQAIVQITVNTVEENVVGPGQIGRETISTEQATFIRFLLSKQEAIGEAIAAAAEYGDKLLSEPAKPEPTNGDGKGE